MEIIRAENHASRSTECQFIGCQPHRRARSITNNCVNRQTSLFHNPIRIKAKVNVGGRGGIWPILIQRLLSRISFVCTQIRLDKLRVFTRRKFRNCLFLFVHRENDYRDPGDINDAESFFSFIYLVPLPFSILCIPNKKTVCAWNPFYVLRSCTNEMLENSHPVRVGLSKWYDECIKLSR